MATKLITVQTQATELRQDTNVYVSQTEGGTPSLLRVPHEKFAAYFGAELGADPIPGTTQAITFDGSGNVSTVTHTLNGTVIRTDAFTFGEDTITEVRTLATGQTLTIVTNLTTLSTTSTYSS